jgi:acyl-CoA synthetase (AMP-forming)/AMP-acid ligase II
MAMSDADGFITIVDRKKDVVITGGINVYPREIENVIAKLSGIAEVAVVGLPDELWGEAVHAFIVPDGSTHPAEAEIIAACRTSLAGFKVPRGVSFVGSLPRNPSGKLLKRELRASPLTPAA